MDQQECEGLLGVLICGDLEMKVVIVGRDTSADAV